VVRYRRERWLTPEGETIVAPLPGGIRGHFGPELRRFVLMQHHQGQVTVERLVTQLQAIGVSISKRQVMRLLIDQQDGFLTETREVLRAGLQTADWISVDPRKSPAISLTPARATAAPTRSAHRSATMRSPGSARRTARAGSDSKWLLTVMGSAVPGGVIQALDGVSGHPCCWRALGLRVVP